MTKEQTWRQKSEDENKKPRNQGRSENRRKAYGDMSHCHHIIQRKIEKEETNCNT